MYIIHPNGDIDDQDMEQLQELLEVLDHQFKLNTDLRVKTHPPDQNLFWDRLSYITGLGFVMCQKYINISCPTNIIKMNEALGLPPMHTSGYSIVQLINTAANYWKHYQVDTDLPKGSLYKSTIEVVGKLGFPIEYPYVCEGFLEKIVETGNQPFSKLSYFLKEWRASLIKKCQHVAPVDNQGGAAVPS